MDLYIPRSVHAASFTWFIYDYLLNFSDEVEYVWSHGRGWTKYAYLTTKVASFAVLSTGIATTMTSSFDSNRCRKITILMGAAGFAITGFADVLLILRLYYMFDRNRRLLIFNAVLYGAIVSASAFVTLLTVTNDFWSIPSMHGSCFQELPPLLSLSWLLGLAFHVYLAALAVVKVREAHQVLKVLGSDIGVLALLVQGNLQYYATILAAYIPATVLTLRAPVNEAGAYNMLMLAAMGIFGPKLLRDMRQMLVNGERDPTLKTIATANLQVTGRRSTVLSIHIHVDSDANPEASSISERYT
ncbi:hypothetical protein EXIGLDRAFT_842830 [Exidia glandulosa HHB12029]|uniref:DUF6533 domain-containing protein n=1 Tax=Exidia glandulosa HHB12029 TaxID=1314781 RepID=A0A165D1A4_EXIGL|nr:hypothetical protein EXIGLDRAFT_842830 [Exidia glandulosa HHB12029]